MKLVEGLLETAPSDRDLLTVVSRGWAEFAFAFLEDDYESLPNDSEHADERARLSTRATALYDRAFTFAANLLEDDDRDIRRALAADVDTLRPHLDKLPKRAVPGLVFGGLAMASAINLNRSDPSRAVDLPKAMAMLERARSLEPSYYYGGAQMVLGLIYCAGPKAVGADPARGQQLFDESAAQTSGRYLSAEGDGGALLRGATRRSCRLRAPPQRGAGDAAVAAQRRGRPPLQPRQRGRQAPRRPLSRRGRVAVRKVIQSSRSANSAGRR